MLKLFNKPVKILCSAAPDPNVAFPAGRMMYPGSPLMDGVSDVDDSPHCVIMLDPEIERDFARLLALNLEIRALLKNNPRLGIAVHCLRDGDLASAGNEMLIRYRDD